MIKTIGKAIDLSALAYQDPADIENALKGKFEDFQWVENKDTDTQVFICSDDEAIWVSFRGTEFTNLKDWITNLDCSFIDSPWGAVHRGFWNDINSVHLQIFDRLVKEIGTGRRIIFTGHSQGAADTELYFSKRCYDLPYANQICIPIEPPRSMSREAALLFGQHFGSKIYHVINNNDVVCRVPTRIMGYNHVHNINLNYLDEDGNLHHDISWWERFKDRVKGRIYDFGELGTDGIKDHLITEIQKIWARLPIV